jgi:putative hemolysin
VELEVKRKKKKEDVQRRQKTKRPKSERPKGQGLAKSAQSYCSTKSETRSSAEKEKGRRSKTPT